MTSAPGREGKHIQRPVSVRRDGSRRKQVRALPGSRMRENSDGDRAATHRSLTTSATRNAGFRCASLGLFLNSPRACPAVFNSCAAVQQRRSPVDPCGRLRISPPPRISRCQIIKSARSPIAVLRKAWPQALTASELPRILRLRADPFQKTHHVPDQCARDAAKVCI